LIIVNDGSTDSTQLVCENYLSDKRVHAITQRNKGQGAARNAGIQASNGEFLAFIDDDDLWRSNKLEEQVAFFHERLGADPETGLVFHSVDLIDDRGKVFGRYPRCTIGGEIYRELLMENWVGSPCAVMFHRRVLEKVGLFVELPPPFCVEDYDMWLRIARDNHVYHQGAALGCYRYYSGGASRDERRMEMGERIFLVRALLQDPTLDENSLFRHWYSKWAFRRFHMDDFAGFRIRCRAASAYGSVGWRLRARFVLSLFPPLVQFMRRHLPAAEPYFLAPEV
jgi:glycosyltransferase involved in cell wall biosynthesis